MTVADLIAALEKMPAGREMDELVAKHIFGCVGFSPMTGWCRSEGDSVVPVGGMFSTTWEGAGLVMEKMHSKGLWAKITSPFDSDVSHWHAGFTPHGITGFNGKPDFRGEGITGPLAICRAALQAVLHE